MADIARLAAEISALGAVNLAALEELGGDSVQRLHDAFAQFAFHGADGGARAVVELVVVVGGQDEGHRGHHLTIGDTHDRDAGGVATASLTSTTPRPASIPGLM